MLYMYCSKKIIVWLVCLSVVFRTRVNFTRPPTRLCKYKSWYIIHVQFDTQWSIQLSIAVKHSLKQKSACESLLCWTGLGTLCSGDLFCLLIVNFSMFWCECYTYVHCTQFIIELCTAKHLFCLINCLTIQNRYMLICIDIYLWIKMCSSGHFNLNYLLRRNIFVIWQNREWDQEMYSMTEVSNTFCSVNCNVILWRTIYIVYIKNQQWTIIKWIACTSVKMSLMSQTGDSMHVHFQITIYGI